MTKDNREEILRYLDNHGTVDKDIGSPGSAHRKKRFTKVKQGVRSTLDLHGLTEEGAAARLRSSIRSCRSRGIRELLVVHGRGLHSQEAGYPVLKKMVRAMLENELAVHIKGYRPARPAEGGEGATVVSVY